MCVPLLVGLAGADWVSDPESRIRCGRAFIVACRHKSGGSFVGLIKQHTEPELDAAPKSWTSAPRWAFTRRCAFTQLYLISAERAILPLHCELSNGCSRGRGKLNKDNRGKTLLMNRGVAVYFAGWSGGGGNKTKLVNLVNSGKHISLPGPAFNLISMLITKLGLWKCACVCKCETERSRENFSLQSLHPHTPMWSSALATEGKTSVSRVSCLHLIKT